MEKTSNIQHPTSNSELLPYRRSFDVRSSMLDVRCSPTIPSLLQRQISSRDPLEVSVVRAQQQRAVFAERFGPAANLPVTHADHHFAADRRAARFPFIGDL